jgi:UDP-N-acetyl-D-glucosamine dehydrogenase
MVPRRRRRAVAAHVRAPAPTLEARLHERSARVVIMGLGYAGLPMATEFAGAGFPVTGLDINEDRVRRINGGESPVSDVDSEAIARLTEAGSLSATADSSILAEADVVFICVPTPITAAREPNLSYVQAAARSIAENLHPGMLVILQSTVPPGTTRRVLLPVLEEESNLRLGHDYFVAFAPERIDPGNKRFNVRNTPKIVGGVTPECTRLAALLFEPIAEQIQEVSSPDVAEMTKLMENSFRFINISFANEMAVICDRLGINVWEVIDAAATKPFAFMPHYPGPGVGGDCIPVVPFHIDAVAREHGLSAEMIITAGRINAGMPEFVVGKLARLLADRGCSLSSARVLVLGVTYKANVNDIRESPALRVLQLLHERGASTAYHDPYVPSVLAGGTMHQSLSAEDLHTERFDAAVLLTPHHGVDYGTVIENVNLVLDTRNFLPANDGIVVRI